MVGMTTEVRKKVINLIMVENNITKIEARIHFYLLDIKDKKLYKTRAKAIINGKVK